MIKVLVIAYTYPPDSRSGTYRVLHFANQMSKTGNFKPYILTVKENCYEAGIHKDKDLVLEIDPKVVVKRTNCFHLRDFVIQLGRKIKNNNSYKDPTESMSRSDKIVFEDVNASLWQRVKDFLTDDLLSFPDRQIGWFPYGCLGAINLVRRENIDIILATGSPWTSFVIACFTKLMTKVPVVLDYRDPWTDNPFICEEKRNSNIHKFATILESHLVEYSDAVILNTNALLDLFRKKFPDNQNFFSIHNGYLEKDMFPSDVDLINNCEDSQFTFLYAGALYGHRSISNFLKSFKKIVEDRRLFNGAIFLKLIGVDSGIIEKCKEFLGENLFNIHVSAYPRMPHSDCLQHMRTASCLLLFQQGTKLQIPRKLFEYLALKKPIFGIVTDEGDTSRLIDYCAAGLTVYDGEMEIFDGLNRLFANYDYISEAVRNNNNSSKFEVARLTNKLESILHKYVV